MTDFANLVMTVDSSGVVHGASALDDFSRAGGRAAGAARNVESSTAAAGAAAARMATQAQSATAMAMATGRGLAGVGVSSRMAAHNLSNLSFQINDVVSGLAMGQKPMQIFTQQAGQFYQIIQQSGLGARGFGMALLEMAGIIKTTGDAEAMMAAQNAAASAAALRGAAEQTAAAIVAADTQLALAEAQVRTATTAEAAATAQAALARAHVAVAAAAAEATIAEDALAVAQGRAAVAADAAAASSVRSLGRIGMVAAPIAIALGLVTAALMQVKSEAGDGTWEDYAKKANLTHKELEKLEAQIKKSGGEGVTWGEIMRSTMDVIAERAGIDTSKIGSYWHSMWSFVGNVAKVTIAGILAAFAGFVELAASSIKNLGKIIVNTFVGAANLAIAAIEGLLNFVITGINKFASAANSLIDMLPDKLKAGLGIKEFGQIAEVSLGRVKGAMDLSNPFSDMTKAANHTMTGVLNAFDKIGKGASDLRDKRIKGLVDEIVEDRTPKKDKAAPKAKEDQVAKELAQLEQQIKAQWRLTEAYQAGDVEAIKAEALNKAEEQALRTKTDATKYYTRELGLAIATRAADAAKMINDLSTERNMRAVVNDQVEQGLYGVADMDQKLADLQQRRSLNAALAIAEEQGWTEQAKKLREVLDHLTHTQADLNEQLALEAAIRSHAGKNDEIERLELETKLLGASNRERAERLALLDADRFIRDNHIKDPDKQSQVRDDYKRAADAADTLTVAQTNYNNALTYTADMLGLMNERAVMLADSLSNAFGSVGAGLGTAITAITNYAAVQAKLDADHQAAIKAGTANEQEAAKYKEATINAQIAGTKQVISGLKGMFKEHSFGYKAMEAAEKALAVVQAVNAAKSLVNAAKSVIAGGAKMFEQLGVWAFPAVAAMVAVMAGLGFAGGSSTATPPMSADDIQKSQGTGTVLGSPDAKSASIANSLELMAKNSTKGIDQTSDMVRSLRAIQSGIETLTGAIARSLNISGGFFDTTGKTGTNSSGGFLGLFGSTTTKSLYDQGITINPASLEQIISQGISGGTYQVIESIKKSSGFLGIGGGTKTSYTTSSGSLDPDVAKQFQLVITNISDSIVAAGKMLGFDVEAALKTFQVQIGQISFKDMNADEIQKTLEAVFSKVADQMAGFAVDGLAQFQKAGEGLYETLMRVAKDFVTVGTALKSIGLIAPASIAARESLIDLAGGLDAFVSQVNYYYENFLSPQEQTAFLQTQVDAAFAGMGVAVPQTIDAFKALVSAQDLTTEAGQAMYAQLMAIAPAFYNLETAAAQAAAATKAAADALAKQKTQLQIDLLNALGKSTEALVMKRKMELDALDPSLRGLQQEVWAAQDLNKAKDALLTAYKRESQELQQTIDRFRGFAKDLRAFRASLFDIGTTNSYARTLTELIKQTALAKSGDEDALGGGLVDAAKTFMDAATANASSLQDVQRARALVLQSVDVGIDKADSVATLAQKQLDTMKAQVSKLVDINESVLSVAQAIKDVEKLLPKPTTPGTGTGGGTVPTPRVPRAPRGDRKDDGGRTIRTQEVIDRLDNIIAATEQTAVSANRTARTFRNAERNGALAVVTDADSPLDTTGVDGGSA